MCGECNWPMEKKSMQPVPAPLPTIVFPSDQNPIFNCPKEEKDESQR